MEQQTAVLVGVTQNNLGSDCAYLDCLSHDVDFETLSIKKIERSSVTLEKLNEMLSPVSIPRCENHVTSHRATWPTYRTTPGFVTYEHRNSWASGSIFYSYPSAQLGFSLVTPVLGEIHMHFN